MFSQFEKIKNLVKKFIPSKLLPISKKLYLKIIYLYYSGDNFICPCCNGHYRKLRSYGILREPNRCCPIDQSLERHRLLWIYLRKETKFFSNKLRVLHFSPQKCFSDRFKNMSNLEYITTDLYSDDVMVKMDITHILYEDNYFDFVICSHVLEHIVDDQKAINEMFRVLKPNGLAIILTPVNKTYEKTFEDPTIIKPEDRRRAFGQEDHVRIYGRDFKSRLTDRGFSVKVENYASKLGGEMVNRYRLREDDIYICIKPM